MTDYKSVTHTIVEMMARKKIKAVPRDTDTKRTELKNVARPDDDRKGDVPTRQGEIKAKVIDEQDLGPIDPKKEKKPKKLEIQDVGKQPPTQVEINPELDNTPNLFASTEVKGKIVEGDYKHPAIDPKAKKSFDAANKLKSFQKSHDFQGGDDTPDPRARREAEDIAKFTRQFQGKTLGGFKITGKLTQKDIEQGAKIRARLNKLREEGLWRQERQKKVIDENWEKYNNISIQYQTTDGKWVTARKTSGYPPNIIIAMKDVQKAYSNNRVRAIDPRGSLIDMLATPGAGPEAIDQKWPEPPGQEVKFMDIEIPKSRRPITLSQALAAWWRGDNVDEEKDYVEVRGRKIYGFKGSPGHKQMQKAAQKLSDREKARRRADKIKTREQDSDKYKKPGWVGPGWNEETQLDELKKETLISFINKRDKQPQKDSHEMKKVWQYGVWPAKERAHRNRMAVKDSQNGKKWVKYRGEGQEASKEEQEAFKKFMKYPSDAENAKGMHKALQTYRAMYFRRKAKEKIDESSVKDLKKAKNRILKAWWDNKGDSTKNLKKITKAINKKELDEQEYKGRVLPLQRSKEGKLGLSVPTSITAPVQYVGDVVAGREDPKDPKNTGKNLTLAAIAGTSAMPPFGAQAGAFAPEPVAAVQFLDLLKPGKAKASTKEKKPTSQMSPDELKKYQQGLYSGDNTEGELVESGKATILRVLNKIVRDK